jgi:predicted ATPase
MASTTPVRSNTKIVREDTQPDPGHPWAGGLSLGDRARGSGADLAIRTPDQRLRVFVSSTLGELAEERRAVARAISGLRLTPVLFEAGARPHPPRELYRAYLAQSDVFIGLYWQRYGWVGPGMDISGLEEEFDLARGVPHLLYVKVPAPDREPRLADLLARIQREATDSYRPFRTPAELGRLVREDLATLLSERFAAGRPPAATAAPPTTRGRGPRPLPMDVTSLVGREQAIDELEGLLRRPGVRLVTLTGPGGVGKTRLAVAVAQRLRGRFGAGSVFVPLDGVSQPEQVLGDIARAVGAELGGSGSPLEALAERLGRGRWLLLLDNLEQVIDAAGNLGELLARCPGVVILATSVIVLGLRAEQEYPVVPLPLPADPTGVPIEELLASPAVSLFVNRAQAVRHDFALTQGNARAVVEICRRLEGLPLAIELAAARTRLLDPDTLLRRLGTSLDSLGAGAVDLPQRQRTLRATVDWSVSLLDQSERSLLETAAVFVDGWTIQAAAQVAGLDEDRALVLSEALARHSLIQLDPTELGVRLRMLDTIRAFMAERLAARADAAAIGRRHADHYRGLAEQADRPLRAAGQKAQGAGHGQWLERLQAEAGNLAAAVRWYLAHDPAPLPHLFRILWPFWFMRDHMGEARVWVRQLLPGADALHGQARAELQWAALAIAAEVGDDPAALAAGQRLAPLLAGIDDPRLHALAQLAMAWSSPIVGDLDGALRRASMSLEELHGQDEPFWTSVAAGTAGSLETTVGRHDDALRHLRESHELAERFGHTWLAATSGVLLGTLALVRGQQEEARALLDAGLELSLAAHSTNSVALCLAGFARLAFAAGDPERSALVMGAAEGLRRRVGLRAWLMLRQLEAELAAQVRQALGADRFDQVLAAGARLNQREAVAAVEDRRGADTHAA